MPELPDLQYIESQLTEAIPPGRAHLLAAGQNDPLLVRNLTGTALSELLGETRLPFESFRLSGPFLVFHFGPAESGGQSRALLIILNLMLAGTIQLDPPPRKKNGFHMDFDTTAGEKYRLGVNDPKHMAKVYIAYEDQTEQIPKFANQGLHPLSPEFTYDYFVRSFKKSRKQALVFLKDQTFISSIGSAYADEILFAARVHPKTRCADLDEKRTRKLFEAIGQVLTWAIEEVNKADRGMHKKVRDHVRVRNRKNDPCPVCSAKIRRASVYGHDTFFCPVCQPAPGNSFIDWESLPAKPPANSEE